MENVHIKDFVFAMYSIQEIIVKIVKFLKIRISLAMPNGERP